MENRRNGRSSSSSSNGSRGQNSSRRGFAAVDPEERREIARMGGHASHGGNGHNGKATSSRSGYSGSGHSSREVDSYDDDNFDYHRRRDEDDYESDHSRGGSDEGRGRQGFASMDNEGRREVARMGGEASHRGRGNSYDDFQDFDYESEYDDQDYENDGGARYHGGSSNRSSSNGHGRKGFASMDQEERREIALMDGRASHDGRSRGYESDQDSDYWGSDGEDYENEDRSPSAHGYRGRSSSNNGNGRQGFASMSPDERREITRRGGEASHGGRGRSQDDDQDYDNQRSFDDYESESSSRIGGGSGGSQSSRGSQNSRRSQSSPSVSSSLGTSGSRSASSSGSTSSSREGQRSQVRQNGGLSFASMDKEQLRKIASKGGRIAHERGTAHEFTSEEARDAAHKRENTGRGRK